MKFTITSQKNSIKKYINSANSILKYSENYKNKKKDFIVDTTPIELDFKRQSKKKLTKKI
ncbi:MAG: hypothetical protein MR750_06035 [Methanobrevibacter boviskoreani]|uniref:hypothetical protein n=1 Tax=Methanobrevibacter boviskoreani TaxID=1348249 RepID=UPI0023A7C53C|nr:hypothetical protein [Methanobrevibacter boviskoreani]MCI6930787.1 hypothetical protein [Methanobrevibacter boviskoreani]